MTLFAQIKTDQLTARKSKDVLAATLLTTLIGELTAIGKNDGDREVTDADVVKLVKKFNDGMEQTAKYCAGVNQEGLDTALAEMEIISKYLPQQMDEAALTAAVKEIVAEVGPVMGKVMGELKARFAGQYDGALASKIVKACM